MESDEVGMKVEACAISYLIARRVHGICQRQNGITALPCMESDEVGIEMEAIMESDEVGMKVGANFQLSAH